MCGCLFWFYSSSDLPALSNFLPACAWTQWPGQSSEALGQSCFCLLDKMLHISPPSQQHIHQVQTIMTDTMLTRNKGSALFLIYEDDKNTLDKVNHQHSELWCDAIIEYKSMESRDLYLGTCAAGTECTFPSQQAISIRSLCLCGCVFAILFTYPGSYQ